MFGSSKEYQLLLAIQKQNFGLAAQVTTLQGEVTKLMALTQAQIDQDTANAAAVNTELGTILTNVQTIKTQDAATITSLQQQLAAAQAANPSLDLSGLETGLASLKTSADSILTAVAPVVAPAPTGGSAAPGTTAPASS